MPGPDPGIHVLLFPCDKDVVGRVKPGQHGVCRPHNFLFVALTAMAAAAVRFSTPSFE